MLNVNRVTLLGHVGRDPELHTGASGDRAARFSLATTERWKDRAGELQERTEWHRIIVFGGQVGVVEERVHKGAAVLVEGRLTVREYTDRQDTPRQATEIIVAGPQGVVNVLSDRDPSTRPGRAPAGPVAMAAAADPGTAAGSADWT